MQASMKDTVTINTRWKLQWNDPQIQHIVFQVNSKQSSKQQKSTKIFSPEKKKMNFSVHNTLEIIKNYSKKNSNKKQESSKKPSKTSK